MAYKHLKVKKYQLILTQEQVNYFVSRIPLTQTLVHEKGEKIFLSVGMVKNSELCETELISLLIT